jgi:hypothetical protein
MPLLGCSVWNIGIIVSCFAFIFHSFFRYFIPQFLSADNGFDFRSDALSVDVYITLACLLDVQFILYDPSSVIYVKEVKCVSL